MTDLVIAVLAAFAAGVVLAVLGSRRPICGCHHHYAFHDPDRGGCFDTRMEGGTAVQCPCRQYAGPLPPRLRTQGGGGR